MKRIFAAVAVALALAGAQSEPGPGWRHLSTATGDLSAPNPGTQQCTATVFDIDRDGINDFVITERTAAPGVVWYRRTAKGWMRYVLEAAPVHIEAGATFFDVDGDGDLDFVAAGDWQSNEVWWWENPYPSYDPVTPWRRHVIKNSGGKKHHDMLAADLDGGGKTDLVFWNQDAHKLLIARPPADPRTSGPWPLTEVYGYATTSQPEQRGLAASFKGVNEHEGLAAADIDGDGRVDLVGGGHWFRNLGGGRFEANPIDPGYAFSRAAAGRLLTGEKRAQAVFVIGDGEGPLMWYDLVKGTWTSHKIADLKYAHNLQLVDFDHDGNLDIFTAEQRLDCANASSRIMVFLGDGKGNFTTQVIATGYDAHESRVADLDGNGTLDILVKPYNCGTPRLDILLQNAR